MGEQDPTAMHPPGLYDDWRWDLVGLPWAEAEPILKARGLIYETVVTAPPSRPVGEGELRVAAERQRPTGLLLVLAYRNYQRSSS